MNTIHFRCCFQHAFNPFVLLHFLSLISPLNGNDSLRTSQLHVHLTCALVCSVHFSLVTEFLQNEKKINNKIKKTQLTATDHTRCVHLQRTFIQRCESFWTFHNCSLPECECTLRWYNSKIWWWLESYLLIDVIRAWALQSKCKHLRQWQRVGVGRIFNRYILCLVEMSKNTFMHKNNLKHGKTVPFVLSWFFFPSIWKLFHSVKAYFARTSIQSMVYVRKQLYNLNWMELNSMPERYLIHIKSFSFSLS